MICGIIDTKAVEIEIELYVNDKCPPFCLIDKILARNLLDDILVNLITREFISAFMKKADLV